MSGYHIRESALSAAGVGVHLRQRARVPRRVRPAGRADRLVAPTLFTFLSIRIDLLQEVAKFRAARRVWARLMRERYGARTPQPAAEDLRLHRWLDTHARSRSTTSCVRPSRPDAAALGGVRPCTSRRTTRRSACPPRRPRRCCAPSRWSRSRPVSPTQLTPLPVRMPWSSLPTSPSPRSGASSSTSRSGWRPGVHRVGEFARELSDAAYRHTLAVESGDRVVGINRFPAASEPRRRCSASTPASAPRRRQQCRTCEPGVTPRPSRRRWSGCAVTSTRAARDAGDHRGGAGLRHHRGDRRRAARGARRVVPSACSEAPGYRSRRVMMPRRTRARPA